jgi:hypothetical protein
MHLRRLAGLALVVLPLVAACNEDNELGLGVRAENRFSATLSGANVRPSPVVTTATASAELNVRDPDVGQGSQRLAYAVTGFSLTSATAVHIHLGGAAVANGQVLATLFTNPTDTAITDAVLVTGSIGEDALVGVSFDSLKTLMQNGAAYIDVHSNTRPLGLIRGQIGRTGQEIPGDMFAAPSMTGAKERPTPVVSAATGSSTFELLPDRSVRFKVTVAGLTGATMAHIHTGVADSAGPIAVTLFNSSTPTGLLTGTLASGTFVTTDITLPGIDLDSLLVLMRRGRTYVNVHTTLRPAGEIRGQIDPVSTLPP